MKTSFWIFIIVSVILVTFSVQNADPVKIYFLTWSVEISNAVIIIATFLIGLITGALYGFFSRKPKVQESETVSKLNDEADPDDEDLNEDDEEL